MLPYFITIIVYLLAQDAAYALTKSLTFALTAKLLLTGACLIYFRKDFSFKPKFDQEAVWYGISIFFLWVVLDQFYSPFGVPVENITYTFLDLSLKLLLGILLAPLVEEFFTRFFLMRYIENKDWKKAELGKYTHLSFAVTVLFFGFSHSRWLAGLVTGVLLNILLYKKKDMNSIIQAHAVANLCLWLYVVTTSEYFFW